MSVPRDKYKPTRCKEHVINLSEKPTFSLRSLQNISNIYWSERNALDDWRTTFCTCPVKRVRWMQNELGGSKTKIHANGEVNP